MPPSVPATAYPRFLPNVRRAKYPRKLRPEKNSTNSQSCLGLTPPSGPYGPTGRTGRMTAAMTAKRAPARISSRSIFETMPWSCFFSTSNKRVTAMMPDATAS